MFDINNLDLTIDRTTLSRYLMTKHLKVILNPDLQLSKTLRELKIDDESLNFQVDGIEFYGTNIVVLPERGCTGRGFDLESVIFDEDGIYAELFYKDIANKEIGISIPCYLEEL